MAKANKETSKKAAAKKKTNSSIEATTPKKKIKVVVKKPDFKNINYMPILKNVGLVLIIVGSFTLIDLAVQYLNNDYSVAVVNGSRISESKWHKRLEKAYGEAAASQLIDEEIIHQEAKLSDVTVKTDEIDEKIEEIKTSIGGEDLFQSALEANNITLGELRDQIELDLLTEKILSPDITYTDDDVKEFFEQYSDVIFPDETNALEDGEKLNYDDYKEQTEEVYLQQQVQTEKSTWLAEKKSEYRIQDNSTNKPAYGFLTTTRNILRNLTGDASDSAEE